MTGRGSTGPAVSGPVVFNCSRIWRATVIAGSLIAAAMAVHTGVNARRLRRPDPTSGEVGEPVSLLVPARNEQVHVARTVASLLAQEGLADYELLVLDDGSTDATAQVLAGIGHPRLRVITAPDIPPPPGWLGKPWACQRLGGQARGTVLVFADADVVFAPDAVRATVGALRAGDFALVSPFPRQLAGSWLERMVQPMINWSWLATLPLGWAERAQRPDLVAANGQFLVLDAAAYHELGGHGAVRDQVLEDMALMRAVRRAGGRAATMGGAELAQCRMYEDPADLVAGYTKSAWAAFGGPVGSLAVNSLFVITFVVPPVAAVVGPGRRLRLAGVAGYLAGVASRLIASRAAGDRAWPDAFGQPASALAFNALNVMSWYRHVRGTNSWKGRPVVTGYPAAGSSHAT